MREGYLLSRSATLAAMSGVLLGMLLAALPVGLIALAVVAVTLKVPPHPERGTKVDYAGAALLALGLSTGLLAVVHGGPLELYAASLAVLAVFVWWERRVDEPIVPATSAAQFSRSIGGAIGVSVMGGILAAGLPAGGAGGAVLASAIHPVFVIGIPLMAVTLAIVLLIPELPLRRTVREPVPA